MHIFKRCRTLRRAPVTGTEHGQREVRVKGFAAALLALLCVGLGCGAHSWAGGIQARLVLSPTNGLRVFDVPPGSAADDAGLQVDDVIVLVDGQPLEGLRGVEVQQRLRGEVGSLVVLSVRRGDRPLEIPVTRGPYGAKFGASEPPATPP